MAEILIKNMEMSKDGCETCPFNKKVPDIYQRINGKRKIMHRTNSCVIDGRWRDVFSDSVPECPLVELPSHRRLIDADVLKETLMKSAYPEQREWYFAEACQFIDEAPTIVEASK